MAFSKLKFKRSNVSKLNFQTQFLLFLIVVNVVA